MSELSQLRGPTNIDWHGQGYGIASYGNDNLKNVIFYVRPTHNPVKSQEQGRPWFVPVDHIKMFDPAEPNTVIDRPMRIEDTHRFRRQYELFLQKKEQVPEGTPIDQLFPNNPAMAENMKSWGVHTIEQAASMSLNAIQNVNMGAQEAQNRAKAYLDQSMKGQNFHKLMKENEDLKEKLKLLTQNHHSMQAQFNALMTKLDNPNRSSTSPSWQPGYDAQAERLNANHPSAEVVEKRKRAKKQQEQQTEEFKIEDQETQY